MSGTIREIIARTAAAYGVTVDDVLSRSRRERVASARQIAMYIVRARGDSFPKTGRIFGRDHATVMFAHRKIARLVASDAAAASAIAAISVGLPPAHPPPRVIRRAWREEQEQYLRDHWEKLSDAEMALELKKSLGAVAMKRKRMGVLRRQPRSPPAIGAVRERPPRRTAHDAVRTALFLQALQAEARM